MNGRKGERLKRQRQRRWIATSLALQAPRNDGLRGRKNINIDCGSESAMTATTDPRQRPSGMTKKEI